MAQLSISVLAVAAAMVVVCISMATNNKDILRVNAVAGWMTLFIFNALTIIGIIANG